jgi:hypothetical protein
MDYRKDITNKIKATSSIDQRRDQRLAESNAKIKKYNEDLAKDTEEQTQPQLKRSTATSSSADQRRDQSLAESNAKIKKYNESLLSDTQGPKTTGSSSTNSASNTMSSFGKSFSDARRAGASQFDYQGKKYAAVTKEEVDKSGSKNLTEYLNKNKSTAIADKGKTAPDDYSQLDTSVQRTPTAQGKTEPDDYSQLDTSVQRAETAADSSDIFSTAKDYVKRTFGLRKGGMPDDVSMERARGVTPEQYTEENKTPHSKNKYKDGGDIHITKGHDYIKDLL